jgi:hypothetical protein
VKGAAAAATPGGPAPGARAEGANGLLARRTAAALTGVALASALALASCGGGGHSGGSGGGSGPTSPPPNQSSMVFTPSGGGSSGIVLATGAGSQGTALALNVQTTGVPDLYAVAFHLTYPYAAMHFSGSNEGTLLNAAGSVQTTYQVVESPPGTLIVGLSRLGAVNGTGAAGTLLTLQFTGVATGNGKIAFTNNQANNSAQSAIQGLSWGGGSVQVTIVPGS